MSREIFLDLASKGHRLPIGTDLVLHGHPNSHAILQDGTALGRVVEETAVCFQTPLAIPLMDLTVEKEAVLTLLGVEPSAIPTYHFEKSPGTQAFAKVREGVSQLPTTRMRASVEAVRYIAQNTSLYPMGMAIGPFSLMTKLLSDPITPVYMAGTGVSADEDEGVRLAEALLEAASDTILAYIRAQLQAGAKAVLVAEPAANKVFISPRLIDRGSDIFDRYVLRFHERLKAELVSAGAELFFHCCGELVPDMIKTFCRLDPAVLSLGSSRTLWEDAALVPKETVLYGNLPSKHFYSDEMTTEEGVRIQAQQLIQEMKKAGHPFILGSECDVLSVDESRATIQAKVEAFMGA
jgi:uroporphyrinogen-III decarboxylase